MGSSLRQLVAPLYLLACLLLGGSAQGIWNNALIQLVGLAIIAWAAAAPADEPLMRPARQLLWLLIAGLVIVALQLIPLPPSVWPNLGGRSALAESYRVLGMDVPPLPISVDPYGAVPTVTAIVPALAIFCAIVRLKAYRPSWLVLALLAGTFAGILLGVLQVASPNPFSSDWYLYRQSSFGSASGFFANTNNMGMLLVICLPFLAAAAASGRAGGAQRYSATLAVSAGVALVLMVGVALNGSVAALGLFVPALLASTLLIIAPKKTLGRTIAAVSGITLIAAAGFLAVSPIGDRALGTSASIESRIAIMSTAATATADFLPLGSGLGTFRGVYQLYEDPDRVSATRTGHSHNDYLELSLELGLPGMLLIAAFLLWWAIAVWRAWRYPEAGPYARAASIASAALLLHSLVEFPLRTAALSACFAMCLAFLVERNRREAERRELRPTRHLELR